ncbi:MAG: hypothetical protein L7S64_00900, partial [Longimicrobiales bacterium]|nr:hypothetical protein [Longimicrobiales bacterium]
MLDLEDQILLAKGVELTEVQTLSQIVKLSDVFALKLGDTLIGQVRPPRKGEKYIALEKIDSLNGTDPNDALE